MANNYRRYQPRRGNASSGGPGRWVLIVVGIIVVLIVGKLMLGGKKSDSGKKTTTTNDSISLVTDNSNTAVAGSTTNSSPTATTTAGSWTGFTTSQCPSAISSFGTKKRVVLTIGLSAANDQVQAVLDTLKAAHVPADFLSTGSFAEKNPDLVKSVSEAGYPVYSQSYDGTSLTTLSDAEVTAAITKADTAITKATGISPKPVFRPPSGAYTAQTVKLLNQAGYCAILWSVDAYDWQDGITMAQAKDRVEQALAKQSGGSIVALHAGYDVTADLMKELINDLKSEHVEITNLAGLLTT